MRLQGKVAIVTGGASGMGRSEATIFAREGARVLVADILEKEGQEVAKSIGDAARFMKLDVTSEPDWQALVATAEREFGKLDILVNNAGISGTYTADLASTEARDRVMDINAKGTFLGMKHAVPALKRAGGGAIVNISSISGFAGQLGVHMAYNASKGAVRIMTKAGAVQWARDNIRVNSVHPGFMPPMRTSVGSAKPEWREKVLATVPMRREGKVEEVAHAVLFLASDEASYITGTELVVDGGFLAV
jgi:NAD(P)-dependent dehydrogenase (short-subunit alcohol dehydrogenase family)